MAPHYRDNDSLVVEPILSAVCWKEFDHNRRYFNYDNLIETIRLLKSGGAYAQRQSYSESVDAALERLSVPKSEWTVIRALASEYFKKVKDAHVHHPLADKCWEVTVENKTREIFLYHPSSMTRSESFFTHRSFELGSVTVEGRPCRNKQWVKLHRQMGTKVTYEILSGRRVGC